MKPKLKEIAIKLRKEGMTYSEILKQIPAAKSTLSLWLRSVGLSKQQKQRLTEKKWEAIRRGGARKREIRLEMIEKMNKEAEKETGRLINNSLWLAGVLLYWAEGAKQKDHNVSQKVCFSNSDPAMIKLFLKWLENIIKIPREDIRFIIFIHRTANVEKALEFWSSSISCQKSEIKVYFKRHKIKRIYRKNTGDNYNGLLRVEVNKSTTLNRKISSWVNAACRYWGVV